MDTSAAVSRPTSLGNQELLDWYREGLRQAMVTRGYAVADSAKDEVTD
jgi:hypothetical protein